MMDKKYGWWLPEPGTWKGTWRDDWRIMGQEGYLMDKPLQYRRFDRNFCREDYLQCEFCWDVFDKNPDEPQLAYFEPTGKYWICQKCYDDFWEHFHWTVETATDG